jgi:putative two-component system response regulator
MNSIETLKAAKILIVDDEPAMLKLLELNLRSAGYSNIRTASHPKEGLEIYPQFEPDIVCTDKHMPGMTGVEFIEALRKLVPQQVLPIVMLTADDNPDAEREALAKGASDFIRKPYKKDEVNLRVTNLLQTRFLYLQIQQQNQTLEHKVRERTAELEKRTLQLEQSNRSLEAAYLETLERLVLAAEQRDDATGQHAKRVGKLSALIAGKLGLSKQQVRLIYRAAPLHDVGKVKISDNILLKTGKLTDDEYAIMKTHVEAGAKILAKSNSKLMQLAELIALTHHERWDGSGYPKGLKGEDIPLEGQIVAVADVFDTLVSERPYKKAWLFEKALDEICRNSGRWYAPRVVEAFLLVMAEQGSKPIAVSAY